MTGTQYFEGQEFLFIPGSTNTGPTIPPRHCIRETFSEGPAPGCASSHWLKVWTFHYSDGTTEQLKQVIKL